MLTIAAAEAALAAYEEANTDLPPQLRRLMGLFFLGRRVAQATMATLAGTDTTIFWRDISRRWWLVLRESGLSKQWERFKRTGEREGAYRAVRQLKRAVSAQRWQTFVRRAGSVPKARPHRGGGNCWYKGGTYELASSWMRLLRTKEPLQRYPKHREWMFRLSDRDIRLLERELHHRFKDQLDVLTVPELKWAVVREVRQRLQEILGWRHPVPTANAAWFLNVRIPRKGDELWVPWQYRHSYLSPSHARQWR